MSDYVPNRPDGSRGRKAGVALALLLVCLGVGYAERDTISAFFGEDPASPRPLQMVPPVVRQDVADGNNEEKVAPSSTSDDVAPASDSVSVQPSVSAENAPAPSPAADPSASAVPAAPALDPAAAPSPDVASPSSAPTVQGKPGDTPALAQPPLDDSFAKPDGSIPAPVMKPVGPMVFTPPKLNLPSSAQPMDLPLPTPQLPNTSELLPKPQGQTYAPTEGPSNFQGAWSGTYDGADEGSFTIRINERGVITGSGTSTTYGARFPLFGTVKGDGSLNLARPAIGIAAFGIQFSGEMAPALGKGSWSSGAPTNAVGSWQMRRN